MKIWFLLAIAVIALVLDAPEQVGSDSRSDDELRTDEESIDYLSEKMVKELLNSTKTIERLILSVINWLPAPGTSFYYFNYSAFILRIKEILIVPIQDFTEIEKNLNRELNML